MTHQPGNVLVFNIQVQLSNFTWKTSRYDTPAWLELRERALSKCHPQHQVKHLQGLNNQHQEIYD